MFRVQSQMSPPQFAKLLSQIVEPNRPEWVPVRVHQGLDHRWQLDRGDKWRLSVHVPGVYNVGHRFEDPHELQSLLLRLGMQHNMEAYYV